MATTMVQLFLRASASAGAAAFLAFSRLIFGPYGLDIICAPALTAHRTNIREKSSFIISGDIAAPPRVFARAMRTLRRAARSCQARVQGSDVENQSRNARAGSVRAARRAGKKHAASETIVITTSADPKASGSRGLTLYRRFPSKRVEASAAPAPSNTPPAVNVKPRDITSRNRLDASAPSAMRSPSSCVLCDTAYDITP